MNIQHIDTRHGTANQANFSNGNCHRQLIKKVAGGSILTITPSKATV